MSKPLTLIQSRFRGSLLGVLVGDCVGAPFERKNIDLEVFGTKFDKLINDPGIELKFTDDTAMSISTCKSLIKNKGLDPKHLAQEYSVSFFNEPKRGYGPAVRVVFRKLRSTNYQDPYGPGASQFGGSGSYGNGAAMRCNGIALFAHKNRLNDRETIDLTEKCSRITHSHKYGINGAVALVLAIRYVLALEEDSFDETEFLDHLIKQMSNLEDENDRTYTNKIKIIKQVVDELSVNGIDVAQNDIVGSLGNDIAAQNSVPLALYSFIRGMSKFTDSYNIDNEFIRTLHWSISCGGDTDTIASMACGLSGAYLGSSKIPESLYKKCESWQQMLSLADQLEAL